MRAMGDLSEIMLKAIDLLGRRQGGRLFHWPDMSCSMIGDQLWGLRGGSNPHTRSAGALMSKMAKRGLVRRSEDRYRTYWRLTAAGRELAIARGGGPGG